MRIHIFALGLLFALSCAAFAQQPVACSTQEPTEFLTSNESMRLHLAALKTNPDADLPSGKLIARMKGLGLRNSSFAVQISVNARGEVQGVQNIEGPAPLLSELVREIQHYRFEPYVVEGRATPFVTMLRLHFAIGTPSCSVENVSGCK